MFNTMNTLFDKIEIKYLNSFFVMIKSIYLLEKQYDLSVEFD